MKQKCAIAIVLMFLVAFSSLSAQDRTSVSDQFKVLLTTGEIVDIQDGQLSPAGLEGTTPDGFHTSIDKSDIRLLDRYDGNNGGRGALIGAGIGLGTALVVYIAANAEASSDPYKTVDNSKVVPVFLGCTGVGALIGWAIGNSQKHWTRVPLDTAFSYNPTSREGKLIFSISL